MMNEKMINALCEKGGNRWQKGNYDRIYFNASVLGLECTYYKTGNVHSATFAGYSISNCEARRMKCAKTYVDVNTGKVHSDNSDLESALVELVEATEKECEKST